MIKYSSALGNFVFDFIQINIWRGVREVEGGSLENCCTARCREFESPSLRHEPVCGQCPQQALPFLFFSTPSFEGIFDAFVEILHTITPCHIRLFRTSMKKFVEIHSSSSSPVGSSTGVLSNIPSITSPDSICAWKSRCE